MYTLEEQEKFQQIRENFLQVVNTEEEEAGFAFYGEDGRGIKDEQLLEVARKEAENTKPRYQMFVDWDGSKIRSKSKQGAYNALYDLLLLEKKGGFDSTLKKEYIRRRFAAIDLLKELNISRDYMNLEPLTKEEIQELVEEVQRDIEKDISEESCPSYVTNDIGIEFASWWGDDGEPISSEEENELPRWYSQSDYIWSAKALKRILDVMDPDGTGIAQYPMVFNGVYRIPAIGYRALLKHKNVKQSLVWLGAFARDSRFTAEDRGVLFEFIQESWKRIKENESTESVEDDSVVDYL